MKKLEKRPGLLIGIWLTVLMVVSGCLIVWATEVVLWSFFWSYWVGTACFIAGAVYGDKKKGD